MLPTLQNSRVSYDFVQYAKFLGIMVSTLQHYHEVWALVRTDDSVGSKFCINSHWKKQILRLQQHYLLLQNQNGILSIPSYVLVQYSFNK